MPQARHVTEVGQDTEAIQDTQVGQDTEASRALDTVGKPSS